MRCNFTIANYRCFDDSRPVRFEIKPGFIAFIGPNNSGKSSLLKFFYENRLMWQTLSNINNIAGMMGGQAGIDVLNVTDYAEIFHRHNEGNIIINIEFPKVQNANEIKKLQITRFRNQGNNCALKFELAGGFQHATGPLPRAPQILDSTSVRLFPNPNSPGAPVDIDCSTFVATMIELGKFTYIGPFRNAINNGATTNYYDIPVGSQFISTWDSWQHGNSLANREKIGQVVDDIKKIFRFESLEIEANAGASRLDFRINGRPYFDNELGSGLSEFVITLGVAATRTTSFIMIDEPEIHLHPSLQVDYLTSLASYAKYGVMFATHSVGLARAITKDIYSCRRPVGQHRSDVKLFEATSNLSEFLGEMSFSSYSELGFSQILLVEGPDDLRVIQQWLRLKNRDHEVLMLSLGGSSLINGERALELKEIQRIHPNIVALVDSERTKADEAVRNDRQAFEKMCIDLKIPVHLTKRRSLDNYLTDMAVKKIKGPNYGALKEFQKLEELTQYGWSKAENWRIAREMTWDEIAITDVGEFLINMVLKKDNTPSPT